MVTMEDMPVIGRNIPYFVNPAMRDLISTCSPQIHLIQILSTLLTRRIAWSEFRMATRYPKRRAWINRSWTVIATGVISPQNYHWKLYHAQNTMNMALPRRRPSPLFDQALS